MKKITLALALFLITGCSSDANRVSISGISFANPQNLKVSADEMTPYEADPDISVTVKPISDYIEKCLESDEQRGEKVYEKEQYYKELLIALREEGYHFELPAYDSMSCGWTNGNVDSEYTEIDGINAIIYDKALYQEVGSLSVFYKQVIFVDEYDQVYDVVFNYDFGELGNYLSTIRDEYGSVYADPDDWEKTEKVWQEVLDYFESGSPILNEDTIGFEENENVINEVIQSIRIQKE